MTPEASFPVQMVSGVPVVAAPEEIDIVNAGLLRAALVDAAVHGHGRVARARGRAQTDTDRGRSGAAGHTRSRRPAHLRDHRP